MNTIRTLDSAIINVFFSRIYLNFILLGWVLTALPLIDLSSVWLVRWLQCISGLFGTLCVSFPASSAQVPCGISRGCQVILHKNCFYVSLLRKLFFFLSFESFEHSSCSGRLVQLVWKFSFDSALPHFLRGRGPDACGDDLALVGSRSPSEDLQQAGDGLVAPPALCLS